MPIEAAKELAETYSRGIKFDTLVRRRRHRVIFSPKQRGAPVNVNPNVLASVAARIAGERSLEHSIHKTGGDKGAKKIVVSFRRLPIQEGS